ncbi:MAG TPA: tRNA threonylcarbamoyladenosine dehydratase [Desulfitobacteriaceae bacterium]|nr:tRNA threonylcarbamoyladenosine dehydratase [Desulfitobacteriaceae bacterium]
MQNQFVRTILLIGQAGLEHLQASSVLVFGIGGVGSYVVEALVRAGVGHLILVDYDEISLSNLNRQIQALHSTVGRAKVEVMKERVLDINPEIKVEAVKAFYTENEADEFLNKKLDYVVDAIDTVAGKVSLARECLQRKIPFIASMGAGNRLTAANFKIADISETRGCPLAKAMRKSLRQEGINTGIKVLFSPDPALKPLSLAEEERLAGDRNFSGENQPEPSGLATEDRNSGKRQIPGSISYVPSTAGLLIAGEVIRDLLQQKQRKEDE